MPIKFGTFPPRSDPSQHRPTLTLYNNDLTAAAKFITRFGWAVYTFNNDHFILAIRNRNLPFHITLAADPNQEGRALLGKFTDCKTILHGVKDLYDHIRSSGISSQLQGYLIHSHRLPSTETTTTFWQLQASIVTQLRSSRSLSMAIAHIPPDHDSHTASKFRTALQKTGWIITTTDVYFPTF